MGKGILSLITLLSLLLLLLFVYYSCCYFFLLFVVIFIILGIGKKLMQGSFERAKTNGKTSIRLTVNEHSKQSLPFYQSLGFEVWENNNNYLASKLFSFLIHEFFFLFFKSNFIYKNMLFFPIKKQKKTYGVSTSIKWFIQIQLKICFLRGVLIKLRNICLNFQPFAA